MTYEGKQVVEVTVWLHKQDLAPRRQCHRSSAVGSRNADLHGVSRVIC